MNINDHMRITMNVNDHMQGQIRSHDYYAGALHKQLSTELQLRIYRTKNQMEVRFIVGMIIDELGA